MKKTECNALKKTPAIIKYREDYLFMLPYLLIFAIFTVFPVLVAMFFSLTRFDIVQLPHFTGLKNYFRLFIEDSLFPLALKNTLLLAVITGPGGFFLSLLLAWVLNEFDDRLRAVLTML